MWFRVVSLGVLFGGHAFGIGLVEKECGFMCGFAWVRLQGLFRGMRVRDTRRRALWCGAPRVVRVARGASKRVFRRGANSAV